MIPRLSIVIVTRNRTTFILDCLESIQKSVPFGTDVAVIDNSESDQTETVLIENQFRFSRLSLRYYRIKYSETVLADGRNFGAAAVGGEIIAFLDDDTEVDSGWYNACLRGFDSANVAAVGGRILEPDDYQKDDSEPLPIGKLQSNGKCTANFYLKPSSPIDIDHIRGCNWSVRRNVFDQLDGFSNRMTHVFEETELCFRIKSAGYRILFAPDMLVHHKCGPRSHHLRVRDPNLFWVQQRATTEAYVFLLTKSFGLFDITTLRYLLFSDTGIMGFIRNPTKIALREVTNLFTGKLIGLWRYWTSSFRHTTTARVEPDKFIHFKASNSVITG